MIVNTSALFKWLPPMLAAASLLVGAPPPASAAPVPMISSTDPAGIVSALQAAGYKAKLSKGDDGDPTIETAAGGNAIFLIFVGCTDHKMCRQIEFLAFWSCTDNKKKCVENSDKWNRDENFAHATMPGEDGVAMYYHLLFDEAGASAPLLVTNLEFFARDAANFEATF